jgi:hypothetical protein
MSHRNVLNRSGLLDSIDSSTDLPTSKSTGGVGRHMSTVRSLGLLHELQVRPADAQS